MGVAREHVDGFNLVARNFEVEDFVGSYISHLDKTVAADYDEEFPLSVVPVLTFGDAWLRDIDADLSAI